MTDVVRRVAIDHLTLPVRSLERSRAFYAAALGAMGWHEIDEDGLPAFGPPGAEDLLLREGEPAAPMHLAFLAASVEEVHAFHAAGLAAGGTDNGAPGPRWQYSPGYYGGFLIDPDGHNVEAVYHGEPHEFGEPPV